MHIVKKASLALATSLPGNQEKGAVYILSAELLERMGKDLKYTLASRCCTGFWGGITPMKLKKHL